MSEPTELPDTLKRYAIWSETKGVFLDGYEWSYNTFVSWAHDRVRTYHEKEIEQVVKFFRTDPKVNAPDARAIEVTPDCRHGLASISACVAAGLPAWEYDRERVENDPAQKRMKA